VAATTQPRVLAGAPVDERLRLLTVAGLGAVTVAASTGVIARHVFAEPTTVKYLATVLVPLFLIFTCLSKDPFRLVFGAAIITAPWNLDTTLQGIRLAPGLLLLALAAAINLSGRRGRRTQVTFTGTVVVVAVALLVPALFIGTNQPHYVTWIASTLVAGWLAFGVAQRPGGLRLILALLVLASSIQALVAIYEFATHANLNLYSSELSQTVSRRYFFSFGADFRPAGTLPDPDALGNILAVALPLTLVVGLTTQRRVLQLFWAACGLLIGVGMVLTFSRMSWVGAGAGLLVVLIAVPGRSRLPALLSVGALVAATVLIGISIGGKNLSERIASIQNPTARTNRTARGDQERKQIWDSALSTASANPVFGTGLGRLQEHLSEHLGASAEGLHAQSVYFQFLAESGIAGLCGLLLLVGHAFTGALAGFRRERMLTAGAAGALLAMLITWTTETAPRYTTVSVTLALLVGAAMAQHVSRERAPRAGAVNRLLALPR
jgi:O-Antigen ligase